MKKPLLTAFLLLVALRAYPQQYHPFPDSGAVWVVSSQACCASNCGGIPGGPVFIDYLYSYYINGDTTVNNLVYHKLYKSGSSHEYCMFYPTPNNWGFYNEIFVGGFRQDTLQKKVFFLFDQSNTECLLYDFDLSVGDTLQGGCQWPQSCAVVTAIDSVLLGNTWRKQYHTSSPFPYVLIEGIGSTAGLDEPLCPFEYSGTLECFSINGQTIYPDSLTACNTFTGNGATLKPLTIEVNPNPFTESVIVKLPVMAPQGAYTITDLTGRILLRGLFSVNPFTINSRSLPSGIYFLQINIPEFYIGGKRLIRE